MTYRYTGHVVKYNVTGIRRGAGANEFTTLALSFPVACKSSTDIFALHYDCCQEQDMKVQMMMRCGTDLDLAIPDLACPISTATDLCALTAARPQPQAIAQPDDPDALEIMGDCLCVTDRDGHEYPIQCDIKGEQLANDADLARGFQALSVAEFERRYDAAMAALGESVDHHGSHVNDAHIVRSLTAVTDDATHAGDCLMPSRSMSPLSPPQVSEYTLKATFIAWASAVRAAMIVLGDRKKALAQTPMASIQRGDNMSIVDLTHELNGDARRVSLVNWYDTSRFYGQLVRLDTTYRPVFSVASFAVNGQRPFAARFLQDCVLVHPEVGLRMVTLKANLTRTLSFSLIRLMHMWEAAILKHDVDVAAVLPSGCCVCDAEQEPGTGRAALQCPWRRLTWHPSCSYAVMKANLWPAMPALPEGNTCLPHVFFTDHLCVLCSNCMQA